MAPTDAGVNKFAMKKEDLVERAEMMLEQADKIHCRQFVTPKVGGVTKNYSGVERPFQGHRREQQVLGPNYHPQFGRLPCEAAKFNVVDFSTQDFGIIIQSNL